MFRYVRPECNPDNTSAESADKQAEKQHPAKKTPEKQQPPANKTKTNQAAGGWVPSNLRLGQISFLLKWIGLFKDAQADPALVNGDVTTAGDDSASTSSDDASSSSSSENETIERDFFDSLNVWVRHVALSSLRTLLTDQSRNQLIVMMLFAVAVWNAEAQL